MYNVFFVFYNMKKKYWIELKWCMQFLRSYCVHKATWPCTSLKVPKGHTKVNIKLIWYVDVENIPIKLQHHTSNTWGVIMFTRQLDLELVLKVQKCHTKINIKPIRDFDVENTTIKLQLDTGNLWRVIGFTMSFRALPAWKFKKVTQRSTSNYAEIPIKKKL